MKKLVAPICISFVALISSGADAALYGAQSDTSRIVEINPTTGAVLRGFTAPDLGFREVGLTGAENGSVLLWQDTTGNNTTGLTRIDPLTGTILSSHPFTIIRSGWVSGLSSQRAGGVDYILTGGKSDVVTVQQGYDGPLYNDFGFDAATHTIGGDGFGRSFAAASIRRFASLIR